MPETMPPIPEIAKLVKVAIIIDNVVQATMFLKPELALKFLSGSPLSCVNISAPNGAQLATGGDIYDPTTGKFTTP